MNLRPLALGLAVAASLGSSANATELIQNGSLELSGYTPSGLTQDIFSLTTE